MFYGQDQQQQQNQGGFLGGNIMIPIALALMASDKNGDKNIANTMGQLIQMRDSQANRALQEKRLQLDQQRYELDAQQQARLADQVARELQTAKAIESLIGQRGVPGRPEIPGRPAVVPGEGDTPLFLRPQAEVPAQPGIPEIPGTGVLGGQIPLAEAQQRLAADFARAGNLNAAMQLLGSGKQSYGQPVKGVDAQGKPTYFMTDDSGNIKPIEGFSPLIEKGLQVTYSPEGGLDVTQGGYLLPGGAGMPATSTTQSSLQKDVSQAYDSLLQLDRIAENYADTYLTYPGKAYGAINAELNKINPRYGDKPYLSGQIKFDTSVKRFFNQYRKEITGAAAAMKELEWLMDSLMSGKMAPAQFKAAYNEFRTTAERSLQLKQQILAQGIPFGSKEFGRRLDEGLMNEGLLRNTNPENNQKPNSISQSNTAPAPANTTNSMPTYDPVNKKWVTNANN